VKKIVVEHDGSITAGRSPRLGGAEFAVVLPVRGGPGRDASAQAGEHGERGDSAASSRPSMA
jgi:hypothetical protein